MDALTSRMLSDYVSYTEGMAAAIEDSTLDQHDRNVKAVLAGLITAHESLRRLVAGEEHPETAAARQAGAEALVKLGYADEKPDLGEITQRFSEPGSYEVSREVWNSMQPTPPAPDDPDWNSPEDSAYDRPDGWPKEADMQYIHPTPLITVEALNSEPVGYCPNHQGDILFGEPSEMHEAPCVVGDCESDGHSTCQHKGGNN
jgi:hypothetical protein